MVAQLHILVLLNNAETIVAYQPVYEINTCAGRIVLAQYLLYNTISMRIALEKCIKRSPWRR